jgi:hypothetical protein
LKASANSEKSACHSQGSTACSRWLKRPLLIIFFM